MQGGTDELTTDQTKPTLSLKGSSQIELGESMRKKDMKVNRRAFIEAAAVLGATSEIWSSAGVSPALGASEGSMTVEDMTALAVRYFSSLGYSQVKPRPVISDAEFNGGLNYDEDGIGSVATRSVFVVQPCARIEDALAPKKPGTLPLFTVLGFCPAEASARQRRTRDLLTFMTVKVGLDPKRLRITTTDLARPLFPEFNSFGIGLAQIRLQSLEKAKADGSGSGWFEPRGHPNKPAYASYSIEYLMSSGTEIEIAEVGVEPVVPHNGGGAIGLERVTMATNDRLMVSDHEMSKFREAIEAEAGRLGKSLPRGYYAILGLEQPD